MLNPTQNLIAAAVLATACTARPSAQDDTTPVLVETSRGLVALANSDGSVYLGWRLAQTDPPNIAFDVYRKTAEGESKQLNQSPIDRTTDYVDSNVGDARAAQYSIAVLVNNVEMRRTEWVGVSNEEARPYIAHSLQGDYGFQKVGLGDLDGDGSYDFVIKHPDTNVDPASGNWYPSPGTYFIEAYRSDGKLLWRRNLGWSIEQGIWYSPYVVYDFDGDGRAEVAIKTAEGDARDADGRVISGPEYLSIWDGQSGDELARTDWIGRIEKPEVFFYEWTARNQLGVAYLDGERPSVIVERGTYGPMRLAAYRFEGGELHAQWSWDSEQEGPEYTSIMIRAYHGQGAHTLHSADVDADGRDEVVIGSAVIDDNGAGLWTTGMGHCDHAYVGDIDCERPGLEIYYGMETPRFGNGLSLVDAATGAFIWGIKETTAHIHSSGLVSDLDSGHPGLETYSGEKDKLSRWLHAADGSLLATEADLDFGLNPRAAYWDADPQRELIIDGRIIDYETRVAHLEGLDGRQAAWADIIGDWREEIIVSAGAEIRIYSTTIPATDRRTHLMDDRLYRLDVAHVSMGYPQPPMTSYCLD